MKSIHPFEPFIPNGATKLIIGTIPPPRFCKEPYKLFEDDVNFYYGSRDNAFWHLLQETFDVKFQHKNSEDSIEERKQFLEKIGIGIMDIIAECNHINDFASDNKLNDIKHQDLKKILARYPAIRTLIYTSEAVKKELFKYLNIYHTINTHDSNMR